MRNARRKIKPDSDQAGAALNKVVRRGHLEAMTFEQRLSRRRRQQERRPGKRGAGGGLREDRGPGVRGPRRFPEREAQGRRTRICAVGRGRPVGLVGPGRDSEFLAGLSEAASAPELPLKPHRGASRTPGSGWGKLSGHSSRGCPAPPPLPQGQAPGPRVGGWVRPAQTNGLCGSQSRLGFCPLPQSGGNGEHRAPG